MSYQSGGIKLGTDEFRYALFCILLVVFSVSKAESAMAIGRTMCGDIYNDVNISEATRVSQSIFTAKIIRTTSKGILKLRKNDALSYSKIEIIFEEIMKKNERDISAGQRASALIIDDNIDSSVTKLDDNDFYAGKSMIFLIDDDVYTISGYEKYDREIYRKIANETKISPKDKNYIVALPCQHYAYNGIFGGIVDLNARFRFYIHQQQSDHR